jgi:transcriptional regulator with XRE-family HTH domain
VRKSSGKNQDEIASILGLEKSHISKIERGTRQLSAAEKTVLEWYFFGAVPPKIEHVGVDPRCLLEFTEAEWLIVRNMATRSGITEVQWISSRIRDFIELGNQARKDHGPGEIRQSHLRVAEDAANYPEQRSGND